MKRFFFTLVLGLAGCSGADPEASPGGDTAGGAAGQAGGGQAGGQAGGGQAGAGQGGSPAGGGDACATHDDCGGSAAGPRCEEGRCGPLPAGHLLGWSDGDGSADLVLIYEPKTAREATDLAFHPTRGNELWVINREYPTDKPCTEVDRSGCAALEGSVTIVFDPGTEAQQVVRKKDPNAWHFMRRPPAFAFGASDTMATCGEARTGNFPDDGPDYIGPTLFSTDPEVFAKQPPGEDKNGSHLDMLHATPWCMGIAHERDNVYWAFNGKVGAIDRNDFKVDHGPGNDDHSDGEVLRYGKGQFKRSPGVPSHLEFSAADSMLYVADTGNRRVARLDTTSGTPGKDFVPNYDDLPVAKLVDDASITDVVAPGLLEAPSGLALVDGVLYVSDSATGRLHAFDPGGAPLRSLDTHLPAGSLAGIAAGPDGKLYIVDQATGRVYRVDPR